MIGFLNLNLVTETWLFHIEKALVGYLIQVKSQRFSVAQGKGYQPPWYRRLKATGGVIIQDLESKWAVKS